MANSASLADRVEGRRGGEGERMTKGSCCDRGHHGVSQPPAELQGSLEVKVIARLDHDTGVSSRAA